MPFQNVVPTRLAVMAILLAVSLTGSMGVYADEENAEAIALPGDLSFTGWGNASAVDTTGTLTFKGWGDGVPSSPENALMFRGWGAATVAQSPDTLAFTGWGGGAMPTIGDVLTFSGWGDAVAGEASYAITFTGWGGGAMPTVESPLAFHGWGAATSGDGTYVVTFTGWGDGAMPTAGSPLAFRGWDDAGMTDLDGALVFKGLDPLPYPCGPEDMIQGAFVQPPALNPGNNHYYQRFTCATDWQTAHEACQTVGAHLVTVGSEAESDYVSTLAQDCSGYGCWIGATDARQEGTFEWVTGEPWAFENWGGGEPNSYCDDENYVHIYNHGDWNDQSVDGSCSAWGLMQYICEWSEAR